MKLTRQHFIFLGPLFSWAFYFFLISMGLDSDPAITAGITLLTVIWWVTEAIPIPATSLVPFVLLPLFGIVDHKGVAASFGSHVIILLMAAFMLSKALEKSGVHQRLAVYMVKFVGVSSAKRLVFGFMLATAFLSMWISNTAATLIMLPIALAILNGVNNPKLSIALILGIAYAASTGGIATPIGTPPNVIFMGIYEQHTGETFNFEDWMKIGVPIVLVAIPLMALWLTRGIKLTDKIILPEQGVWRSEETRTLIIFGLTVLAWVTRHAPFGGWSDALDIDLAGDSTVALTSVVVMFLVSNGKGGRILNWESAKDIPWGMLLLFAGGIALAKGMSASGLSNMLGEWLSSMSYISIFALVLLICIVVVYLTEITSNTATATLLMPILAAAASGVGVMPEVLMIPAAMVASCAYMLPVATAPNAIVYGAGKVAIADMVREGASLSLFMALLIGCFCYILLT
ncbi:SLC13/DASS family transporter [Parashewanella spongiae]|uniref:SLC13/DASS family transporter n=1 Tax=Parashewanella spongiae TaxID=342950 RepID=A0A3A6UBC1_9GAMM|nr:SLC13 family permease [Parashewanella spongiae]MCL1077827.1 SLC13 family permease [Parashewanella spongiae]RJY18874.1 SLC13/DASS family transporter [Parashewanella spongiae]